MCIVDDIRRAIGDDVDEHGSKEAEVDCVRSAIVYRSFSRTDG